MLRKKAIRKEIRKPALSIRLQLMIGFIIPILFVIITGLASYSMSSKGLQENYETSAYKALQMTMNSYDEAMKNISSITLELAQDSTVTAYSLGGYDSDNSKQSQANKSISNNVNVKQTSSNWIEGIHVIPVSTDDVITTQNIKTTEMDSFIDELASADEGSMLSDNYLHWGSTHPLMDEKMGMNNYALYCSQSFNSGAKRGVVVIDISRDKIKELLSELDYGEGCYLAFVKGQPMTNAFPISGCIGLALLVAMTISSLTGTVIPLFFNKIHVDPAVASGPLISTVNDLVAVVTYYGLAWILLLNVLHVTIV